MKRSKLIILGAGISGLSAAYHYFKKTGQKAIVIEKNSSYGGLLDNIIIDDFVFDTFVHFSFTKDAYVRDIFSISTEFITHFPVPYNYSNGYWIKHPVQNNIMVLPLVEKIKIIIGFLLRPKYINPRNYEQWLISKYGRYFYTKYPLIYTLKYWRTHPKNMGIDWIGNRMYKPSLKEVIKGSISYNTNDVYYASQMRYPLKGGFKSFLKHMAKDLSIDFSSEVIRINPELGEVVCSNGNTYRYETLVSSLPLTKYAELIENIPNNVLDAITKLRYTSAIIVSMGFNVPKITDHLWFYIYNLDILASRIHSPSLKSPNNAPSGFSSLQSEIYFLKDEFAGRSINDIVDKEIDSYIINGFFKREDLIFYEFKVIEYANIIFDLNIVESRKLIRDWLAELNIVTIGRFGHWDYYWSDDSLISGKVLFDDSNDLKSSTKNHIKY